MKYRSVGRTVLVAASIFLVHTAASAAPIIDFETTPSGSTPIDNSALSNPYTVGGITAEFAIEQNGSSENPMFEQAGEQTSEDCSGGSLAGAGFVARDPSGAATCDVAEGGDLGNWFIRSDDPTQTTGLKLIIDYTSTSGPVTAASGEIWDIDGSSAGNEEWTVSAYNGSTLLDSIVSPLGTDSNQGGSGTSLDAMPWTFAFSGLSSSIDRIELEFTGSKNEGIGLAFNNFRPTSTPDVPEPGVLAMFGVGLAGIGFAARRRRQA